MDINYLREVFNPWGGFVYSWHGNVPNGQDPTHHITEQFIIAAKTHDIDTLVVDLADRGGWVLYVNREVEIDNEDFVFEYDLAPEPYVEEIINGEDSTQITPPPEGGTQ